MASLLRITNVPITLFAPAALATLMALPDEWGVTFSAPHSCCKYAVSSWKEDPGSSASQKRVVVVFRSPLWVCQSDTALLSPLSAETSQTAMRGILGEHGHTILPVARMNCDSCLLNWLFH